MRLEITTTIDGKVVTEVGLVGKQISIYRTKNDIDVEFYFVDQNGCCFGCDVLLYTEIYACWIRTGAAGWL